MLPVLTTLVLLLAPGLPDIIPSGMKGVRVELRVELGEGVRGLCFAHEVQKGDTFAKIASEHLGSPSRWSEIAALNPDVEPTKVRLGEILWIPPREPLRPGELPMFVYGDPLAPFASAPRPFTRNVLPGRAPRGHLVMFLVPATEKAEFDRLRDGDHRGDRIRKLVEAERIDRIECEARPALVPREDPTVRRIDTYRIDRHPETGALGVAPVCSDAFDADGEPVQPRPAGGEEERKKEALLFVLLAASGGVGLLLARRRRPVPVPSTA